MTTSTFPVPTALLAGVGLTVGFACALVSAVHPSLISVWTSSAPESLKLIADGRRGAWKLANWLFAIGMVLTLTGLAGLTQILSGYAPESPLPMVALTLAAIASVHWIAALTFRLTTTLHVIDSMTDRATVPDWYLDVQSWADHGLMCAGALMGGAAMVLYGITAVSSDQFAGWVGWFAVACGALLIVEFALTRDVIPALLYVGPLPLGVSALLGPHL